MSIFNFFRKTPKPVVIQDENLEAVNEDYGMNQINEQLFVDNLPPSSSKEENKLSHLEEFMQVNFELKGLHDGYLYPNAEILEANLKQIRSQFRLVIDRDLDKNRSKVHEMNLHAIEIKGMSERLEKEIDEKISQFENLIHQLDTQKILSIEDDGMIASRTQSYRIGFIKGLDRYHLEKTFAGSTGLFSN